MKRLILSLAALMLLTSAVEAKVGKVKYGKYIVYEGEVTNDAPSGQGTLTISDAKDKDITFISITGNFNGRNVTDALLNASDYNALEFEGTMSFEPKGEEGKAMEMAFTLKNGTLYHDDIEYRYKRLRHIGVTDLVIDIAANKQTKEWTIGFGPNATQTATFLGMVPDIPLPRNVDLLGFSTESMRGFFSDFTINDVLINSEQEGRFIFNDGSYFAQDIMHFANGDEVRFVSNDWEGSMTYADGTRISKDQNDNFSINFQNGDTYEGTLRRPTLQDLARKGTDHPDFKYNNGVLTTGGQPEKWFNGESFSTRHERLAKILRLELLDSVEADEMTEADAIAREKELKAYEEQRAELVAQRRIELCDDSIMVKNNLYPAIFSAVKGKKFAGQVFQRDAEGIQFAKKIQLWININFVSGTHCVLNYKGNAVTAKATTAKGSKTRSAAGSTTVDEETTAYLEKLQPSFINDGSFAYCIEGGTIYLYETNELERIPFSFKYSNGTLTLSEFSGQLKAKK